MKNLTKFAWVALVASSVLTACGQNNSKKKNMEIKTEADKFSYSLGMDIGKNVKGSDFDSLNVDLMIKAIEDVINEGDVKFTEAESQQFIQQYIANLQNKKAQKNLEAGEAFLAENAKKDGIVELESGLQYEVIKMGNGEKPSATSTVKTHYHGTLIDGTVFDSSVERGQPASFPVNRVIAGWTEALQLMPVGSKWRLFVPSNLAYGPQGSRGAIGPNETLIFEVELLAIEG